MGSELSTDAAEATVCTLEPVDEKYSGLFLLAEIIQRTVLYLPFEDVRRYYRVCKAWYNALNSERFWKRFVFKHFNFQVVSERNKRNPLQIWMPGNVTGYWSVAELGEHKVFNQMPKYLLCGVVTPPDFDVTKLEQHFQGLAQALWILKHMKSCAKRMNAAVQAFGNESDGELLPVLIPWTKKSIPKVEELLDIFTIPRRLCNFFKFKLFRRMTEGSFGLTFTSFEEEYGGYFGEFDSENRTPVWTQEDDKILKKPDTLSSYRLEGQELRTDSSDSDINDEEQSIFEEEVDDANNDGRNNPGDSDDNRSTDNERENNGNLDNREDNEADGEVEHDDQNRNDFDEEPVDDNAAESDDSDEDADDDPYSGYGNREDEDDSEEDEYNEEEIAEMERMKNGLDAYFNLLTSAMQGKESSILWYIFT